MSQLLQIKIIEGQQDRQLHKLLKKKYYLESRGCRKTEEYLNVLKELEKHWIIEIEK